jgi:hypothetical protein
MPCDQFGIMRRLSAGALFNLANLAVIGFLVAPQWGRGPLLARA